MRLCKLKQKSPRPFLVDNFNSKSTGEIGLMLVELKRLNITNEGYKRGVSVGKIYVNPSHVISIRDYDGANDFLLSEGLSQHAHKSFSLVKMNNIRGTEEVIVLGTSQEIYEAFHNASDSKGLLNG